MNITGTHINYFRLCPRKSWLFIHGIHMEHNSELVADGKLIEEESYQQRSERYTQLELSSTFDDIQLVGKIDFYDTKERIIHETKRSNKVEQAHIWQVKFYLWLLELNGIEAEMGLVEYPRLREREKVFLDENDKVYLKNTIESIKTLVKQSECPPVLHAKICKSCSYYDFCYAGELLL